MLRRIASGASAYGTNRGVGGLLPFFLVTLGALCFIPSLEFSAIHRLEYRDLDVSNATADELEARFSFVNTLPIVITGDDAYSTGTLRYIRAMSDLLSNKEEVQEVFSVSTVQDLLPSRADMRTEPLLPDSIEDRNVDALRATLSDNPVLSKLLLAPDSGGWIVHVVPAPFVETRTVGQTLFEFGKQEGENVHSWNAAVLEHVIDSNILKDFFRILFLSLLLVWISQFAITKSWYVSFVLWSGSLLPTLWVLALFPIVGLPLQTFTILVPTVVLAISTSYGIHLYRHATETKSVAEAVRSAGPTIIVAALTTAMGFGSLLLSHFVQSRQSAALIIAGIAFAVIYTLLAQGILLGRRSEWLEARLPRRSTFWKRTALTAHPLKALPLAVLLVVTVALIGTSRTYTSTFPESFIRPGTDAHMEMRGVERRLGGIDQLALIVDTGEEYGLVNVRVVDQIRGLADWLASDESVSTVLSFTDFVSWANGRMQGSDAPIKPNSAVQIGEALELLRSNKNAFSMDAIVDPGYRTAQILFQFGGLDGGLRQKRQEFHRLRDEITAYMGEHFSNYRWRLSGTSYRAIRQAEVLLEDQITGIILFFSVLLVVLWTVFGRIRLALTAILPPIAAVGSYLGAAGWFGIPITAVSTMILALLMGVSVDDVVYYLYSARPRPGVLTGRIALEARKRSAGMAIFQTTIVLSIGVVPLVFSFFKTVGESGLLVIFGMWMATAVTLFLVPLLLGKPKST